MILLQYEIIITDDLHLRSRKPQSCKLRAIEYSENKIIACFEDEDRPGMLQSSVQQTCNMQIMDDSAKRRLSYFGTFYRDPLRS